MNPYGLRRPPPSRASLHRPRQPRSRCCATSAQQSAQRPSDTIVAAQSTPAPGRPPWPPTPRPIRPRRGVLIVVAAALAVVVAVALIVASQLSSDDKGDDAGDRAAAVTRRRAVRDAPPPPTPSTASEAPAASTAQGATTGGDAAGQASAAASTLPYVEDVQKLLAGVPQNGTILGDPNAPVTITEYADLRCPSCRSWETGQLETLLDGPIKSGEAKLDLQVLSILGPDSDRAAVGALGRRGAGQAVAVRDALVLQPGAGERVVRDRRLPAGDRRRCRPRRHAVRPGPRRPGDRRPRRRRPTTRRARPASAAPRRSWSAAPAAPSRSSTAACRRPARSSSAVKQATGS